MIKKGYSSVILHKKSCFGYLLESPHRDKEGDSEISTA